MLEDFEYLILLKDLLLAAKVELDDTATELVQEFVAKPTTWTNIDTLWSCIESENDIIRKFEGTTAKVIAAATAVVLVFNATAVLTFKGKMTDFVDLPNDDDAVVDAYASAVKAINESLVIHVKPEMIDNALCAIRSMHRSFTMIELIEQKKLEAAYSKSAYAKFYSSITNARNIVLDSVTPSKVTIFDKLPKIFDDDENNNTRTDSEILISKNDVFYFFASCFVVSSVMYGIIYAVKLRKSKLQ